MRVASIGWSRLMRKGWIVGMLKRCRRRDAFYYTGTGGGRLTKITGRREAWDLGRQITGVSKLCQRYGPWDDGGICVVRGRRA